MATQIEQSTGLRGFESKVMPQFSFSIPMPAIKKAAPAKKSSAKKTAKKK